MNLETGIIIILLIILVIVLSGHIYIIYTKPPPPPEDNCYGNKYGCCPNSQIPKLNEIGSNCKPYTS